MTIEITKEMIEEKLGFEINNFTLKPKYENDVCIGLDVFVDKKASCGCFETKLTIVKTGDLKNE